MTALCLTILGGAREVGANSYHVEFKAGVLRPSHGLLLDAGMHPKKQGEAALPAFDAVSEEAEAIIVSHAHLDHVGALPLALKRFPRARVTMTAPTAALAVRMLRNAVAVGRNRNRGRSAPLYTEEAVEWVQQVLRTRDPGRTFPLDESGGDCPAVTLYSAGHLLGAVGVLVEWRGRRLFYTGDTCASAQLWSGPGCYPQGPVDLLLLDSTHGADEALDVERDAQAFARGIEELGEFISTVAARGGSVLMPVFAMGRSQEILGVLQELRSQRKIPQLPIYVSGLTHVFCRLYDAIGGAAETGRHRPSFRLEDVGYRLLNPERMDERTVLATPSILALTSGMMFPGTLSHHFARAILPDSTHGVALVGFLDEETPGYRLAHATPGDTIDLSGEAGRVRVSCSVRCFPFTGHSRASQLLQTVARLRPEHVVLVHGSDAAVESLARRIADLGLAKAVTVAEPRGRLEL
jgi:Cft2 family RNA processing exonuclease